MTDNKTITDATFQFLDGLQDMKLEDIEVHGIVIGAVVTNKQTGDDSTLLLIRDGEGELMPMFSQQGLMRTLNEVVEFE